MTKKVPPGGRKMNLDKNRLRHVDQWAMPIGTMVSLFILPIGNPKSAKGGHPYLGKWFPFLRNLHRRFDLDYIGQIYGEDFAKIFWPSQNI
jgi:hypothetical protein